MIITYEIDDREEPYAAKAHAVATDLLAAVSEFLEACRQMAKHKDDARAEWARDELYAALVRHSVDIND